MYSLSSRVSIRNDGITTVSADVVVNAANEHLAAGSGVCGYIFKAAGYNELSEACEKIGHCDTGNAVITLGFKLPANYIIHAVGPRWHGGNQGEAQLLYSCYRKSMELAMHHDCKVIAFPVISAGIFGYPYEEALKVAFSAISDFYSEFRTNLEVVFAIPDNAKCNLAQEILIKYEYEDIGNQNSTDDFVFFWHEDEENGCFSNWYPCTFSIEGIKYYSTEQYMMAKKALLFGDFSSYSKIMAEKDPHKCKSIGKTVSNFDSVLWDSAKQDIVYRANTAKFWQNWDLQSKLINTGKATLAEASPYDTIWGIGLAASNPAAKKRDSWNGQNLLGDILCRVRDEINQELSIIGLSDLGIHAAVDNNPDCYLVTDEQKRAMDRFLKSILGVKHWSEELFQF